ncbi:MAG: SGNH/GDSL hydrolase family protein [Clostridia bacterium]|nr:SGNH/GDSL hydrolase family protein [Clostridia bacterium]
MSGRPVKRINALFTAICIVMIAAIGAEAASLPYSADEGRLSAFDYDLYMYPAWAGEAVYQELTVFYVDGNGDTVGGRLLYKPEKIISVRNFGLKREFKEGRDFTVTGQGIALTEDSGISVMPRSSYCDEDNKEYTHQLKDGNGGAIKTDNSVLQKYYLAVTYTTNEKWDGPVPGSELDRLPGLAGKLKNKKPVTIAILGDSISVGYTTSGLNDPSYRVNGEQITCKVNIPPYMPIWPKLVGEALKRAYGYDDITVVNWAVGGTNTASECLPDMIDRVISSVPDLVIVGFGMNEFWSPAESHGLRLTGILETLHASLPDAEYVLVSSMLPNMLAYSEDNMHLADFEREYYRIREERDDLQIAVAPLNGVYCYARQTKGDFGLLGGNQNHPNDFGARLYAQTVAAVLGVYDTPAVLTDALPDGKSGDDYSADLIAYCEHDVEWSAEGLPEGVRVSADGRISGIPVKEGEYTVSVTASSGGRVSTSALVLKIAPGDSPASEEAPEKGHFSVLSAAAVALSAVAVFMTAAVTAVALAKKKRKN